MIGDKTVEMMKNIVYQILGNETFTELVYGTVISLEPLEIQIEGESGLILPEDFLILSPFCQVFEFVPPCENYVPGGTEDGE